MAAVDVTMSNISGSSRCSSAIERAYSVRVISGSNNTTISKPTYLFNNNAAKRVSNEKERATDGPLSAQIVDEIFSM